MFEIWKDIPDYEGIYQVSNFGNVRSLTRNGIGPKNSNRVYKGKLLKPKLNKGGYSCVHLRTKKESWPTVHRLVAICFIDNPENKETVNHIDGVKTNNRVDNLEWATSSEQMIHAISNGLYTPPEISKFTLKGETHPNSKISDDQVNEIIVMREQGYTLKVISDKFKISISQVHRITRKESRIVK